MLALIISPYNAPTAAERAANVRLGIALARWAAAQGYTPVGWWDMIDINDPPDDADPNVRLPALKRDGERARMVGAAGGVAVVPGWITRTHGMQADIDAFFEGGERALYGVTLRPVSLADLAPYLLPVPVPAVPRAAVQAAVDTIEAFRKRQADIYADHEFLYHKGSSESAFEALKTIMVKIGVTPTEVR